MEILASFIGVIILFFIGMAFLIPGIISTAITGKVKHGPKAPRVLSIIALVIGICLCMLSALLLILALLRTILGY